MHRVLVADKIAEAGLERLRAADGIEFDVKVGLSPQDLARIVGEYHGLLVRSAVQVTAETLAKPGKLAVIARAGVGVDNIDVAAATAAGILVLNTPDANTISTAEHTIAMILALQRRIPAAHQHVIAGQWNRAAYQGEQLAEKTLGIVGLGRIGRAVMQRALAFEMNVVAYDPFVTLGAAVGPATIVNSLDELLAVADCVTLHATLSDQTRHMIGGPELAKMKAGATLINCARGALIDEHALADALNAGRLAGAAIDVFEHEPPSGSPLLTAKNVVLTPHLAASTAEAQLKVSIDAVDALLVFLLRGEIRSAVNVAEMPAHLPSRHRAYMDLCSRMGAILSPWCDEGAERIGVIVNGEELADLASTLSWQAMVAVLGPHMDARLNLVNARDQARRRGLVVETSVQPRPLEEPQSIVIEVQTRVQTHTIEGTVPADRRPRVLSIDGYRMELVPERTMVLIFNDDRPGVIGLVGQRFGKAGINIADMALSRRGKTALMVLKLDAPMPDTLRDALRAAHPPILSVRTVTLPAENAGFTSP